MNINGTWVNPSDTPENRYKIRTALWLQVIDNGQVTDPLIIDRLVETISPWINTTGYAPGGSSVEAYRLMRRYEDYERERGK